MIEVKHLTKRYGSHTAVSDLSFTVEKGQIYGFLGPNGAGKSTTMNIMTGCLAATSGEVVIGGYDIFQDAAQATTRTTASTWDNAPITEDTDARLVAKLHAAGQLRPAYLIRALREEKLGVFAHGLATLGRPVARAGPGIAHAFQQLFQFVGMAVDVADHVISQSHGNPPFFVVRSFI